MKDNGGPAFPQPNSDYIDHPVHWHIHRGDVGDFPAPGMSLRDWFAGQALAGCIAHILEAAYEKGTTPEEAAEVAAAVSARCADAMLAERSR